MMKRKILIDNFTAEEIDYCIGWRITRNHPGSDTIPAEFITAYKHVLSASITTVFN